MRRFGYEPSAYAINSYAITQRLLHAFRRLCARGISLLERRAVTEETLWGGRSATVLGALEFDANGDSNFAAVTVYEARTGAWAFLEAIGYP